MLIDLKPSKHLYSAHSFFLGATTNSKISFPKFKVHKKSQNSIKKILHNLENTCTTFYKTLWYFLGKLFKVQINAVTKNIYFACNAALSA